MSSHDPFQNGRSLVFKTISDAGTKRYLNSSAAASKATSVYMDDGIDFAQHRGCHWICKKDDGDTAYRFQSWSTSASEYYLDASAAASKDESVYIASHAGAGSYWVPSLQSSSSYIFTSQTPSGNKNILTCNPRASKEDSVYLSDPNDPHVHPIQKLWIVGVDYYYKKDVEDIIHGVYPEATISSYRYLGDVVGYGSMDFDTLSGIWKASKLGEYQETLMKFDKDAFAVCLKAEVAKYAYKQSFPGFWCLLCGIMWGIDSQGVVAAFNFTIDPFRNLIFFNPLNGEQIDHTKYLSLDFCML